MKMNKILGYFGVGFTLAAVLGCGGSGGGTLTSPDPKLYYVNASVDATSLDFYNDDTLTASAVAPLKLSTATTVKAGDHDNVVYPTGTTTATDATSTTFNGDTSYLIALAGQSKPDSSDVYGTTKQALLLTSSVNLKAPTGSKARILFIQSFNRASGFQTPQVDFTPPGDNVPSTSKISTIDPVTLTTLDIDVTNNSWELRRSGTDQVYIAATTLSFSPGGIYVVMATGIEGQTGTQLPQFTSVRIN